MDRDQPWDGICVNQSGEFLSDLNIGSRVLRPPNEIILHAVTPARDLTSLSIQCLLGIQNFIFMPGILHNST